MAETGAHQSAGHEQRTWTNRTSVARALRIAVFLTPIAAAILLTRTVVAVLPEPSGIVWMFVWWLLILTTSITTGAVVDKEARKLLPVAALMSLSLVFPDEAPSRFKLALRRSSVRDLERRLKEDSVDPTSTPNDAAAILVEMAGALNSHDRNTRGHTERVRAYALMIGEELGLSPAQLNKLHWAALVHDVGKLKVPPEILSKPGKPDDDEWAILKQHPAWGNEMVEPLRPWLGEFANATGQHHERWDGNGYPSGLKGTQISLAARIVAVADAYDVMTSIRSYKTAMDTADARKEVTRCSGTQFDPRCARALITASLGQGVKTRQAVVWAIRAPVLALTARSSLLSNGGTVATTVAATAAAVAVAAPVVTAEEPLPFVEPVAIVEQIDIFPSVDQLVVLAGTTGTADVTINDQIGTDLSYGSPELYVEISDAAPASLDVSIHSDGLWVTAEDQADEYFEIDFRVCANERSCVDSTLVVLVEDGDSAGSFVPGAHIRAPAGEAFTAELWPTFLGQGPARPIEFTVTPGDPTFFDGEVAISADGEMTFLAGPRTGLTTLSVSAASADGETKTAFVYVLLQ